MGKVMIIGAGGVASVAAHKVAQNPQVFSEVMIASRTREKCIRLVDAIERAYAGKPMPVRVSSAARMRSSCGEPFHTRMENDG